MTDQPVTLESAIHQAIDQLDGPTSLNEVVQRVLAIRPSQAKNPAQSVRNSMRNLVKPPWAWFDERTLIPLRLSMRAVRFRITPSRSEVERGTLLAMPAFHGFLPAGLSPEAVQLVDASGAALPASVVTVKEKQKSFFGDVYPVEHKAYNLAAWFKKVGFRRKDSLLVTVEDWEAGRYRIEHEPAGKRQRNEVARKNRELADLLFSILEQARRQSVSDEVAIHTAYARMSEPDSYPGDHWIEVVAQDPRMKWVFGDIRYADATTPFESLLQEQAATPKPRISQQQGQQIYRFKAALKYRSGLWRRIEIQGEQTLGEFDRTLRQAFEYDTFDHMSGFWKRVRRGESRRFREIDLGSIDPFGEGKAAEVQIAGLDLQPGDQLKYVYDFGDWIEHILTLEEVEDPEMGASYPRIVAQSKRRYH